MDGVRLLDRTDSKYVFASRLLPEILINARDHYRILNIGNNRIFSYRSIYFDTAENKFYLDHHNGRSNRYKVRFRTYVDTGISFLEVKYKTKNGRTIKNRIRKDEIETRLSEESMRFIRDHLPFEPDDLESKICTSFKRITLVCKNSTGRVTIDFDLKFENNEKSKHLGNLAVAEIKQSINNGSVSEFAGILNDLGINPTSMSKYCIGRVLVDDSVKYNQFKKNLLAINKIDSANDSP